MFYSLLSGVHFAHTAEKQNSWNKETEFTVTVDSFQQRISRERAILCSGREVCKYRVAENRQERRKRWRVCKWQRAVVFN